MSSSGSSSATPSRRGGEDGDEVPAPGAGDLRIAGEEFAVLMRWIELARRRAVDRAKARAYSAAAADAEFRAAMADYDAFVDIAEAIVDPAFPVGMAMSATGDAVPIRLPLEALAAHWVIQGGTGVGKTTFAASLVAWALAHEAPIGVVDCKSGFFQAGVRAAGAVAYTLSPPARESFVRRIAIFNPFGEMLPPFNVCAALPGISPEVQAYDVTLALSRLFDATLSIHMENILRHLVILLIASKLTLVEAPLVLQDELLRGLLLERAGNIVLKDFFFRTYPSLPRTSTDALLSRLSALLLPERLRLMLGADAMVDLRGIITRGDPLLVFLGKGNGIPEEQVNVLAGLFLQCFFQAAYASEGNHRPYVVALDEFFHLLDSGGLADRFATALAALRSFGVHLALVMHNFAQVPPTLREAILTHCDYVATFRSSARNAEFLGDFLPDTDPDLVADALDRHGEIPTRQDLHRDIRERLQRLPNRECYWYDRRQPYRALRVRVPDVPEPHEQLGIGASALDAFIVEHEFNVGAVALSRETLRQQIAMRADRLRELVAPPIRIASVPTEPPATTAVVPASALPSGRRRPQLG